MRLAGRWFGYNLEMEVEKIKIYKDRYHDEIILIGNGFTYEPKDNKNNTISITFHEKINLNDAKNVEPVVALHIARKKVGSKIFYDPDTKEIWTESYERKKPSIHRLWLFLKTESDFLIEDKLHRFFEENNGIREGQDLLGIS